MCHKYQIRLIMSVRVKNAGQGCQGLYLDGPAQPHVVIGSSFSDMAGFRMHEAGIEDAITK